MDENRLSPGQFLPWTSRTGEYGVVVRRTDAGETWTMELLCYGQVMVDENGQRQVWAFNNEATAMELAFFAAESLRDLERVPVASAP